MIVLVECCMSGMVLGWQESTLVSERIVVRLGTLVCL